MCTRLRPASLPGKARWWLRAARVQQRLHACTAVLLLLLLFLRLAAGGDVQRAPRGVHHAPRLVRHLSDGPHLQGRAKLPQEGLSVPRRRHRWDPPCHSHTRPEPAGARRLQGPRAAGGPPRLPTHLAALHLLHPRGADDVRVGRQGQLVVNLVVVAVGGWVGKWVHGRVGGSSSGEEQDGVQAHTPFRAAAGVISKRQRPGGRHNQTRHEGRGPNWATTRDRGCAGGHQRCGPRTSRRAVKALPWPSSPAFFSSYTSPPVVSSIMAAPTGQQPEKKQSAQGLNKFCGAALQPVQSGSGADALC